MGRERFGRVGCRAWTLWGAAWVLVSNAVLPWPGIAWGDEPEVKKSAESPLSPADAEHFEKRIRPVLVDRCWSCHGPDAQEGELRLDSRSALLEGGSRGPAIVPEKPEQSLLLRAINHADTLQMPPKEKLPLPVIADFRQWVQRGAVWPGDAARTVTKPTAPKTPRGTEFTEQQRRFWSFQPVRDHLIPSVVDARWGTTPMDRFVLARLEARQLRPSPRTDRRTLLRRVTLDLMGLPPSAEAIDEFTQDSQPDALARQVDRILASPRHGERWGRHWLDIARYADSNGLDENLAYANAWRYRDYVIQSLNRDKPYDEFIREQLAGDLIPLDASAADATRADVLSERLTATGFLVLGAKMLAEDDPVKMRMDIIDEQIDTVGKAVLGLTLGCARCHDHKYDPIDMADYYALAGILHSTKTMENFSVVARWQERPIATPAQMEERAARQAKIDALQADVNRAQALATETIQQNVRRNSSRYLVSAVRQLRRDVALKDVKSVGQARMAETPGPAPMGLVVVEAEDYTRGNALKTNTGYGQGIGVILNAGPLPNVAEYEIELASAGLYQLELRYAAAESRPVVLSINGRVVKNDAASRTTGSWNPDTQTWVVEGFYRMPAGRNTIRLERAQPFPHFDKLLVVPAPAAVQDSSPPEQATLERGDNEPLYDEFVQQWAKYWEQSAAKADSPLAEFHWHERRLLGGANGPAPPARLIAEPWPTTVDELMMRLGQQFAEVEAEWQMLVKATSVGATKPTSLADPSRESLRKILYDPQGPLAAPKSVEQLFPSTTRTALDGLRAEIKKRQEELPKFPEVMAVSDGTGGNVRIHLRGNHTSLGAEVPRGFPRLLAGGTPLSLDTQRSGRWELAQWLTHADHPLTSRVIVNRIWLWHFGEGLVRSPDNFGILGQAPTHPELLDWLARRFVEQNWSLKRLHRELVLSEVYGQSSRYREEAFQADPENQLWWRMPRRRLEAESLRDALLAVGGTLDLQMGGTQLTTPNRQYVTSTANVNPVVYSAPRRSVYLPVVRSALYDVFQAFDFADPSVLSGKRESTTVAPQALFMLNSSLVADQAKSLAADLLRSEPNEDRARVVQAFRHVLGRVPTDAELQRSLRFVEQYQAAKAGSSDARHAAWQGLCRSLMAANEFVYVD